MSALVGTAATARAAVRFTVTDACVGCGACLLTCPVHAIRPAGAGAPAPLIVLDHCDGCAECGEVCPADACVPEPPPAAPAAAAPAPAAAGPVPVPSRTAAGGPRGAAGRRP